MKVYDDGCICEFCPYPEDVKKKCEYFLFTTGIQRSAEAVLTAWPGFAMRIEMVECAVVARAQADAAARTLADTISREVGSQVDKLLMKEEE